MTKNQQNISEEEVQELHDKLLATLPYNCGEFTVDKIVGLEPKALVGLSITMSDGSSGGTIVLKWGMLRIEEIDFAYTPGISYEHDQEVLNKVKKYFASEESLPFAEQINEVKRAYISRELYLKSRETGLSQETKENQENTEIPKNKENILGNFFRHR